MRLFRRIAIVGVGLIGGSLALALKQKKIAPEIIGVSRHQETLKLARKKRLIDRGSQNIKIIADADLVIFATPADTVFKLAQRVSGIIKKDCIVTDVASTKEQIVRKLDKIFPNYIGSHPLAGSEKRGVANARPGIFKNSTCILTPTKNTNLRALKKISLLWKALGAKTVFLAPDTHDKILSFVSHLAHAVAFSLINSVPGNYLKFASGGLRDTTRIAASDSLLWEDIFLSNQKNVLKSIGAFEKSLAALKSAIKKKDRESLNKILKLAKTRRVNLG